jgi:hypothetical protein
MTRKELITQIKSKDYEPRVKNVVSLLTSNGMGDAITLIVSLYDDLSKLMNTGNKNVSSKKYFDDECLNEAFNDFVSMRVKIKKPLTANALKRAMIKLENLSGGNTKLMIKILNQSVDNCWAGLFPLHDTDDSFKGKHQNPQRSQLDAILGSITDD